MDKQAVRLRSKQQKAAQTRYATASKKYSIAIAAFNANPSDVNRRYMDLAEQASNKAWLKLVSILQQRATA